MTDIWRVFGTNVPKTEQGSIGEHYAALANCRIVSDGVSSSMTFADLIELSEVVQIQHASARLPLGAGHLYEVQYRRIS
jgi:hypothetical protein